MSTDDRISGRPLVFLSSSWEDLKNHRAACIKVMLGLRDVLSIDWIGMEGFGADDKSPKEYCLTQVRRSRLYVGIFGSRYGTSTKKADTPPVSWNTEKHSKLRYPA